MLGLSPHLDQNTTHYNHEAIDIGTRITSLAAVAFVDTGKIQWAGFLTGYPVAPVHRSSLGILARKYTLGGTHQGVVR